MPRIGILGIGEPIIGIEADFREISIVHTIFAVYFSEFRKEIPAPHKIVDCFEMLGVPRQ